MKPHYQHSEKNLITLCRVPWYLFPGFPNPAISHGVYSTFAATPSGSGIEADTLNLLAAKFLELKQMFLGNVMQVVGADTAHNIDLYEEHIIYHYDHNNETHERYTKKKYKLKNIIKKEELKQQDIVSLLGDIE